MAQLFKENINVSNEKIYSEVYSIVNDTKFLSCIGNSRDNAAKVQGRFDLVNKHIGVILSD